MTWVRYEDDASEHPKVAPLDDATYRLWREAIEWSSRRLTDGVIVREQLMLVSRRASRPRAAILVARALWHEAGFVCDHPQCPPSGPDGWVIHDYFDFQPTRAKVIAERAAKAERQRNWLAKRKGKKDGSRDASQDASVDESRDGPGDALLTLTPSPPPPRREAGKGTFPEAPPAAVGGEATSGGGRSKAKPHVTDLGDEDPAVIEADRRRLEAVAAHQESLNLEAEERAKRGAAAAREAIRRRSA